MQEQITTERFKSACEEFIPEGFELLWYKGEPNRGYALAGMGFYTDGETVVCRVLDINEDGVTLEQDIVGTGMPKVEYVEDLLSYSKECLKHLRSVAPTYPVDRKIGAEREKFAQVLTKQGIVLEPYIEARNFMFKVADAFSMDLVYDKQKVAFGGFANFVSFDDLQGY